MVVRGHIVGKAVHVVGNAVIADVRQQENIFAAHGVAQNRLTLSRTEAGALYLHQIIVFHITMERRIVFNVVLQTAAVFYQMVVNLFCQRKGGFRSFMAATGIECSSCSVLGMLHLQGFYNIKAVTCQADSALIYEMKNEICFTIGQRCCKIKRYMISWSGRKQGRF